MKNQILKIKSVWLEFIIWSIFIGSICFILVYGIASLDVTNDNWLLNAEDLNQHYIGWKFFRRSDWRFPVGLIQGITETPISIIYTDSIPLFAVLFKLASPILPKTFQYFGLWGIVSFILQAYFAMILLNVFIKEKFAIITGSIFFVMSPMVLMRMFGHTALGGNWLILAALSAWAYRKTVKGFRSNIMIWSTLMVLAVTVHMYYIPMVLAIMCASYLNQILDGKKEKIVKLSIVTIGISIVSALIVMYALGAFYGEPNVLQGGVRQFSANLNTFFNSQGTSMFLKGFALISSLQGEGYGYLGLGVIVMLALGITGGILNKKKIEIDNNFFLCLIILTLILGGYALSPCITWNARVLINIPWPEVIIKVFSIFRVTGRFVWPIYYIIFTLAIVLLIKVYSKKLSFPLLIAGIVLQMADISPLIKIAHERVEADIPSSIIQNTAWGDMKADFDKIEFITSFSKTGDPQALLVNFFSMKEVFDIAEYACDNQMNINDFYIGRRNGKYIEDTKYANWCGLLKGDVNERTIYIFSNMPYILIDNPNINIYECDGLIIGISSNYKWINEPENKVTKTKPVDIIRESMYINNGVDIDGQRIIYPNGISYGPYAPIDKGIYQVTAEGKNLKSGDFDVFSHEKNKNIPIYNLKRSSEKTSFNIKLLEPIYDIEIRLANNQDDNIILKKLNIQKIGDKN
ncbi:DUF6311 domain-containing protein [Clostridium sp. E02]|uniref:DUF6311 domain-containing protein n=1 Tax=Clostridium sp. E02 TaxID=2487134 RepID=UPI000F533728|nr:DUF6311 domain-containing protein [Clostridium sp. E02]